MMKMRVAELNDTVEIVDPMGKAAVATVVAVLSNDRVRIQWGNGVKRQWMTLPIFMVAA